MNNRYLQDILAAIILYACVIVYQGYQYGQSDQSQILPVIFEQDHPGTYAKDHYVQQYLNSGINERTIYHFLLRYLGYDRPLIVFIWHALASFFLIWAWIRIAGVFIAERIWKWLCIGFILTVAYHTNTGSNELYYNQLVPSLPAKALASWAIYFWLHKKYWLWSILLILAAYLQPLVGLQFFIVTCLAIIFPGIISRQWRTFPWIPAGVYVMATLPWIYLLSRNNGGQTDTGLFVDILEFRLSHHFFGSYFSAVDVLVSIICVILVFAFYRTRQLKWMFGWILIGLFIYETGAELLRLPIVLYTQWWKSTILIEAFAVIAFFAILEKKIRIRLFLVQKPFVIMIVFLLVIILYRGSGIRGIPPYMQPLQGKESAELEISLIANEVTMPGSLFIIPPEITAFRWYAKRDTYIDYKAMLHNEKFLFDWYSRIEEIYGYNMITKAAGMTILSQARENLSQPGRDHLEKWKSKGITHLISYSPDLTLTKSGSNGQYTIYQLD